MDWTGKMFIIFPRFGSFYPFSLEKPKIYEHLNWIVERYIHMFVKPWIMPFILALCGIITDYITTTMGLNFFTGLRETNVSYSPIWALLYFWGAIAVLTMALPRKRPWSWGTTGLALAPYIGVVNNALVIIGLFPGFTI